MHLFIRVQTLPEKSFNLLYRTYGPLEPWFDKSWKPGNLDGSFVLNDIEVVN